MFFLVFLVGHIDCDTPPLRVLFPWGLFCFRVIPLYPGGVKFKVRKECEVSNVVKAKISPIVDVCWGETYLPHEVEDVEN